VSDYFDRVEAQIVRRVQDGSRPSSRIRPTAGHLAVAAAVLVVIVVAGVFLAARGGGGPSTAANPANGLAFVPTTVDGRPAGAAAIARTVQLLRERLAATVPDARVSSTAHNIVVRIPHPTSEIKAEIAVLAAPGRLAVYDWEANALTPAGDTVASRLQFLRGLPVRDQHAFTISQGGTGGAPGDPGSGSMALYQAVRLASNHTPWASPTNSRKGAQYWMFGAPGSAACAEAARAQGTVPVAGQHCLLNGPDDNLNDLRSNLSPGVSASDGEILTVPRGWVVLEAVSPNGYPHQLPFSNPQAQFYVLQDNIALGGSEITNPHESTAPTAGSLDVTFGFNRNGKNAFQNVTYELALRGSVISGPGRSLNQHLAVALDNQLITVPSIDYKQYPGGLSGDHGAEIAVGSTKQSARNLAILLRYGPLPVNLTATG
jgi:hypothetical protein